MPGNKKKGGMKDGAAASGSGSSTANVSGSSTTNVSGVSTPVDSAKTAEVGGTATSDANDGGSATSTLLDSTTSSTNDPTTATPEGVVPKKKKKRDRPRHGPGKNRQAEILAASQAAALLAGGQDASSSSVSATVDSVTVEGDPSQNLVLQTGATHEKNPVFPSSSFSFKVGSANSREDPGPGLAIQSSALAVALQESTELKQKLAYFEETFEEAKKQREETDLDFKKIAEEYDEQIEALKGEVEEEREKGKEKAKELEFNQAGFEIMLQQKENEMKKMEVMFENQKKSMKKRQDVERAVWNKITESNSAAMKKQEEDCGNEKAALEEVIGKKEADNKLLKEEIGSLRVAIVKESDNASALSEKLGDMDNKWKETYQRDLTIAIEKGSESARKIAELEEAIRKCHQDREEAKKNALNMEESATTTVLKKKIDELQAECHKYWGQLQQFQDDSRRHDEETRKLTDEIAAKNIIMSDLEIAVAKNEKEARAAKEALAEAQRSMTDIEAERKESNRNFDDIIRKQELGKATIENQNAEIESLQLRIQQLDGEVTAKDQSMHGLVAELSGLNTQLDELISVRNHHDRQKPPDAPYSHLDPEDHDALQHIPEKREDRHEGSLGTELENLDALSSSDDEIDERDAKIEDLLGRVSGLEDDLQAALASDPELEASKAAIRLLESEAVTAQIQREGYETRIQELEVILASTKSEDRSNPTGEKVSEDGRIQELENEIASLKAKAEEPRLRIESLTSERDALQTRIISLQNEFLQQPGSNSEQPIVAVVNISPITPSNLPPADPQPVQLLVQPIVTVADIPAIAVVEVPTVLSPVSPGFNNGHNAAIFNWAFNPFKAWWRVYLDLYVFFIRLLNLYLPNGWQLNEPFPPTRRFYLRDAIQSRTSTPSEVHTMIVEPPKLMLNLLMLFCHGLIYYLLSNYVFDINYLRDERNLWLQANDLTRQMVISFRGTGDLGYGIRWLDKLAFDLHVRSGFDRSFPG